LLVWTVSGLRAGLLPTPYLPVPRFIDHVHTDYRPSRCLSHRYCTALQHGPQPAAAADEARAGRHSGVGVGLIAFPPLAAVQTVTGSPVVGSAPYAVAVNPVTNKVYVANISSGTVTVIDGPPP
jgi:hypothetical protein